MKTFRTVYRIPTLIIVLCFWTISHAQTEPYVDWVFDFEQAQKADDAEAVTKLYNESARACSSMVYGFVYDVVNKGVPVGEQAAIRSRCDLIARTLANVELSEQAPSAGDGKPWRAVDANFYPIVETGRGAMGEFRSRIRDVAPSTVCR